MADQHPSICIWCMKKEQRRYLRSLMLSEKRGPMASSSPPTRHRSQAPRKGLSTGAPLHIILGYIMLVIDTNILLSSLASLPSILENSQWTIVVPVPVIMKLNGLSSNTAQLGEAARAAMVHVSSLIRSHSSSLKVQTSKGNHLSSLSIRTEQVDFQDEASWERNMDDLILRTTIWQDEH